MMVVAGDESRRTGVALRVQSGRVANLSSFRTFGVAVDLEGDAFRAAFCPHISSYVGISKLPLR